MIGVILRKELLLQLYSPKFVTMTLLVLLLSVTSSLFMVQDFNLRQENYEVVRPTGDDATTAVRPPDPDSVLVKGLDEMMGRPVSIWRGIGMVNVGSSQSAKNRMFMLFRQLDFQFIITVVLSLAAMLFTFDAFSGEKGEGTLKLNMANPVSRTSIVIAKWLSACLVSIIPFLLAFIIFILFVFFSLPSINTADFLATAGFIFLGGAIYMMSFVSIGMLISSLNKRRGTSLVVSLLIWALLVFVVPNSLSVVAKNNADAETLGLLRQETLMAWFQQTFKRSNGLVPDEELNAYFDESATMIANQLQRYNNGLARQIDNLQATAFLSPAQSFNIYNWAVTGTGPRDNHHFNEAVIRFQQQVTQETIARNELAAQGGDTEDFKFTPFQYENRPLQEAFTSEALPNLAVLVFYTALGLLVANWVFNRYDVR